jgi:hypothetical protein
VNDLRAPFPYYGGKARVADVVWARFGDTPNFVEPFFGSGAVLLKRPHAPNTETVNDLDALLANFWRALQHDPEAVARYADWPVNEVDLHARHRFLVDRRAWVEELMSDPAAYDAQVAGWWVWGISQWIGSGWCPPTGTASAKMPSLSRPGRGLQHFHRAADAPALWQARPDLSSNGRGVAAPRLSRQMPMLHGDSGATGRGVHATRLHRKRPIIPGRAGGATAQGRRTDEGGLQAYFHALADRLRRVRVCCGDWTRVLGPSVTWRHGVTAVFLDPPYVQDGRADVYAYESSVFGQVRQWAIDNGANPLLRIALCGYDFAMPNEWTCHRWKAPGGYGSQGEGRGRENAEKEMIYFSPHCLQPDAETPLERLIRESYETPLSARLAAFGWTLEAEGAGWVLHGCGSDAVFGSLAGVEEWLTRQEGAKR